MRRISIPLIAALALAGCGDDADDTPICDRADTEIRVVVAGTTSLAMYRAGMGEWRPMIQVATGDLRVCASSDYTAVVACVSETGFSTVFEYRADIADGLLVGLGPCGDVVVGATLPIGVQGQMRQAGAVSVGPFTKFGTAPDWPYSFRVNPGEYTVVATDDRDRLDGLGAVAIRRRQQLTSDKVEDPIDLDEEGIGIESIPLTITGLLASDSVKTETRLHASGTIATISTTRATTAHRLPPGTLVDAETQSLSLFAYTNRSDGTEVFRAVSAGLDGTTQFDLLPPVDGVVTYSSEGEIVQWESLPAYTQLYWEIRGDTGERTVIATRRWMDAFPSSSLALDTTADGFDPTWVPGTLRLQSFELTAGTLATGVSRYSNPANATTR